MYFYTLYGYKVQSDICLPSYPKTAPRTPEIIINKSAYPCPKTTPDGRITVDRLPGNGLKFFWHGVGCYEINQGTRITVRQCEGSHPDELIQPFYSFLPAALLSQRDYMVLHGSAIDIMGQGIIVTGAKGRGKSTLTATLLARGHRLITDDITAINITTDTIELLPGIPNLKIWSDAARATGINFSNLTKINPFIDKYNYALPHHYSNKRVPLTTIIFLTHGEETNIEEIPLNKRILWLIANSYFSRYTHALSKSDNKRIFKQSVQLAQRLRILILAYPRNLQLLPNIATIIENKIKKME